MSSLLIVFIGPRSDHCLPLSVLGRTIPTRVIPNLNIERAAELRKYSSATRGTLFCRGSILLTIYAYKEGGG